MEYSHHGVKFDIEEEWLTTAGIAGSVPHSRSYRVWFTSSSDRPIYEASLDEVEPLRRDLSHGVFNDGGPDNLPARDRVVQIFTGFVVDAAIPPVELLRTEVRERYRYRIKDGVHRFYCSLVAGFTHIPAVEGFDFNAWQR
jgi:hypothetical protein